MANQFKIKKTGNTFILFDADILDAPSCQLFEADYHTKQVSQQNILPGCENASLAKGVGRAKVVYFLFEKSAFVLKHYYRGGLIASIIKDKYLGLNPEKTRAFKEFRLLKKMQERGLPVAEAVAARVDKGLFFFRGDLITKEIKNVKTLADSLLGQSLTKDTWADLGDCIKRFHLHNIYHADLNARNILLNERGEIHIIDFDNSYFRRGTGSWKSANLLRLRRSLVKFKKNDESFCFDENNWSALLAGYEDRSQ